MAAAAPVAAQVIDAPQEAPAAPRVAPTTWPYDGGSVPAGHHVEEQPRTGLITAGTLTLAIPWALGVGMAAKSNFSNQAGWLIVPVLGPWLNIATRKAETQCSYSGDSCELEVDNSFAVMMTVDGLVQAAGAIMLIYGLASPKRIVTRDLLGSLHFTPAQVGKLGCGGVLSGEF